MSLFDNDRYHEEEEPTPRHSELTLSTGVIVGAFFGLALLCALFFWFGYTVRGGSKPSALPTAQVVEPSSSSEAFNSFKPAAGSPVGANAVTAPATAPVAAKAPAATSQPIPAAPKPTPVATTPAPAPVTPSTANGFYVQVAAVSHQQDADKLAGTLHAEGYLVTARQAPQDSLFHVQIGPYATRKDADLIRQKLIGEGYTPIVK